VVRGGEIRAACRGRHRRARHPHGRRGPRAVPRKPDGAGAYAVHALQRHRARRDAEPRAQAARGDGCQQAAVARELPPGARGGDPDRGRGGRIARVDWGSEAGRVESTPAERVTDAMRELVIPGVVDAHSHFYGTLIPGLIDRLPLDVRRPFLGACTDGWTERDTWVATM